MSTQLEKPPNGTISEAPPAVDGEYVELRDEIRRQGKGIRDTQKAFSLFAVIALMLSLVTLLAVVFKLDKKTTTQTVTAAAPAATAGGASGTGAAAAAVPSSTKAVLNEFSIAPAPAKVAAGKVSFNVNNAGKIEHEFVVIRTNKPAADLLKGNEADETGNVGEVGSVLPGQTKNLKLNLKAGHYALICNLPGHYKSGQHADLTVVAVKH